MSILLAFLLSYSTEDEIEIQQPISLFGHIWTTPETPLQVVSQARLVKRARAQKGCVHTNEINWTLGLSMLRPDQTRVPSVWMSLNNHTSLGKQTRVQRKTVETFWS